MSKRAAPQPPPSKFTGEDLLILVLIHSTGILAPVAGLAWIHGGYLALGTSGGGEVLVLALLGLAAGGFFFGGRSSSDARPLVTLGRLLLFTGLWVGIGPFLLALGASVFGSLPGSLALAPIILPAAFGLGGVLPLAVRGFVVRSEGVAGGVGLLSGLLLLGAVEGTLVGGLYLLPEVGANVMLHAYGLVTLVSGFLIQRSARARGGVAPAEPVLPGEGEAPRSGLPWVVAFGAVAGALLVFGPRFLALLLRASIPARVAALAAVLLGATLGAFVLAGRFQSSSRRDFQLGTLFVLFALSWTLLFFLPPSFVLGALPGAGEPLRATPVIIALLLVPGFFAGGLLPLAVRREAAQPAEAARAAGRLVGALACGLVAGGALWLLVLQPVLGPGSGVRAATLMGLVAGGLVWLTQDRAVPVPRKGAFLLAALVVWGGWPAVGGVDLPADYLARGRNLQELTPGAHGSLAIVEQVSGPRLEVDGSWRGEARRNHHVMLAHLPMALHAGPKDVAVLGLASGQTARAFLNYDVDSLTVVDPEPALPDLVRRHFDSAWMDDPRSEVVTATALGFLSRESRQFDLITLDPGPTFLPGASALYSLEFYRGASERLAEDGLFCQVLPLPFLGLEDVRSVVRTFLLTFPGATLWFNTSDLLLIGTRGGPQRITPARLTRLQAQPRIAEDLSFSYWGGREEWLQRPEVFVAGFLMGTEGLKRFAGEGSFLFEERTALEYGAFGRTLSDEVKIVKRLESELESPSTLFEGPAALSMDRVLELRRANLSDLGASSLGRYAFELRQRGELSNALAMAGKAVAANPRNARAHRLLGDLQRERGNEEKALASYREALAIDPDDPSLRTRLARTAGGDEALMHLEELVRMNPRDIKARIKLGDARVKAGDLRGGVEEFRAALSIAPQDPDVHYELANALSRMDESWTAMDHYARAIELRPDFAQAYCNLAILKAGRDEMEQAFELYAQAIEHEPTLVPAHYNLSIALRKAGRFEEAEAAARRTLEIDPRLHAGYDHLGTLLMDQERYGEAITQYEKALELAPNYGRAKQNLAVARRRAGT